MIGRQTNIKGGVLRNLAGREWDKPWTEHAFKPDSLRWVDLVLSFALNNTIQNNCRAGLALSL